MKNPFILAFGHIIKRDKRQFMLQRHFDKMEDCETLIAEQCAISRSTLRSIEAANYIPSSEVALRLCSYEVFSYDFVRLCSLISIFEITGKQIESLDQFGSRLDKILTKMAEDSHLSELLAQFLHLTSMNNITDKTLQYHLYDLGLIKATDKYLSASTDYKEQENMKKYQSYFSSIEELDKVLELGTSLVGDSHIDLLTLKERYEINQQIVTCINKNESSDKNQLCGYYIIYPLNLESFNDIMSGSIINGRDIKNEHICSSFSEASAIYIGMLGGLGLHASGYIVDKMIRNIAVLLNLPSLKAVFARGATSDGKRMLTKFGFQKLKEPSEISCLFINEDSLGRNDIQKFLYYK